MSSTKETITSNLGELSGENGFSAEFVKSLTAAAEGMDGLTALSVVASDLDKICARTASVGVLLDRAMSAAPNPPTQETINNVGKLHELVAGTVLDPDDEEAGVGSIAWLVQQIAKQYLVNGGVAENKSSAQVLKFPGSGTRH